MLTDTLLIPSARKTTTNDPLDLAQETKDTRRSIDELIEVLDLRSRDSIG
jgi:hypothetical protein